MHLGQHRRRGHGHRALVGLDLAPHPPWPAEEVVGAVEDHRVRALGQGLQRPQRGPAQGLGHARLVDLLGPRLADGVGREPARQHLGEPLAVRPGEQLGVGEPDGTLAASGQLGRRAQARDGCAHHDRTGPGAPADLVHPGDQHGSRGAQLVLDLVAGGPARGGARFGRHGLHAGQGVAHSDASWAWRASSRAGRWSWLQARAAAISVSRVRPRGVSSYSTRGGTST